jgi:hypothetical protein
MRRPEEDCLRDSSCSDDSKLLECLGLRSRPPPIACPLPDGEIEEREFVERGRIALLQAEAFEIPCPVNSFWRIVLFMVGLRLGAGAEDRA